MSEPSPIAIARTKTCGICTRTEIPVAPGFTDITVPHVCFGSSIDAKNGLLIVPCKGDRKRQMRDALGHPAETLARQWTILDDDRLWEGL